jgi:hypothetical protein
VRTVRSAPKIRAEQLAQIASMIREGEQSEWRGLLQLRLYKLERVWEREGFRDWSSALASLVEKSKKSRSNIIAKLGTVELLHKGKVTHEEMEKMGSTNATQLRRYFRLKGLLPRVWVEKAMEMGTEEFREAVAKAVQPEVEPLRKWSFLLPLKVYGRCETQVERIQKLLQIESRPQVAEFLMLSVIEQATDEEIMHSAGEGPKPKEKTAKGEHRA